MMINRVCFLSGLNFLNVITERFKKSYIPAMCLSAQMFANYKFLYFMYHLYFIKTRKAQSHFQWFNFQILTFSNLVNCKIKKFLPFL